MLSSSRTAGSSEGLPQHFGLDDCYFGGENFLEQMTGHLAKSDITLDEDGDKYRFLAGNDWAVRSMLIN